ncbi:MAG: MarR family transcriptional regulator [Candidatus Nanopelagicaceae bacterium]
MPVVRPNGKNMAKEILALLPTIAVNLRLSALLESADVVLTPSQLLCAVLIDESESRRMSAGEIARCLSVSPPAATALVDRLVKVGLFSRSQGADRRVVWVSLTDRGSAVVEQLMSGLIEKISLALGTMDRVVQEALIEALRQVAIFAREITGEHDPKSVGDPAQLVTP